MTTHKFYGFVLIGIILIIAFLIYISNIKYTVSFDTDGGTAIDAVRVKKGEVVSLPPNPTKENSVFLEWQLGNKKYNEKAKITKNITLKAKYLPEIYAKVSFDTNGGNEISSMSVLSGLTLDEKLIQEPKKEGYNFEGWYYDGKPYDFKTKIVGNIELEAHYSKSGRFISSSDLKVGDKVIIVGNYASSIDDSYAYHTKAMGWTRTVLAIFEGSEYPYQVGNEYGTTGFFKSTSIKK